MNDFVTYLRVRPRIALRLWGMFFSLVLLLFACSHPAPSMNVQAGTATDSADDCVSAARKVLGPTAQIAKCGNFIGKVDFGAVAFVKLNQFAENRNGIPVSRLVILQKVDSQWNVALDVAKQIQNPSGYVGIDYIDDSQEYPGYRALLLDRRSDGKAGFVLQLSYLRPDGKSEGVPIEISWNPAAERFQEFSINEEPEGFKPELKNPPHIHSSGQKNP